MVLKSMIAEKTRAPDSGENDVVRTRLEEQLHQSLHVRLTTVIAPAGFDKTSLVSGWITRNRIDAAWVSLKEGDDGYLGIQELSRRTAPFLLVLDDVHLIKDSAALLRRKRLRWSRNR